MNKKETKNTLTGLEIAVIGMAGRFPGAKNIDEFWDNLKNGVDSVTFFSDEQLEEAGIERQLLSHPNYVKANRILEDIEYFDALFFDYTPKEAALLNPQVRFFLECSWEALENAGYNPDTYDGLIGLYAGASSSFYWEGMAHLSGKSKDLGIFAAGNLINKDYLCTLVSYKLNLMGPSVVVDTACSTALVAIHWACRAVLSGECSMALAGGVAIHLPQTRGYMYQEGLIFSPDGRCWAFDENARGTVGGNGMGIVVLKRLKNAIKDGDNICAVIKGSAINNDGKRKIGFTAPSAEGQAEVIRTAMAVARVETESIGYIESHGTGTSLGDSVEIEGLKLAFKTNEKGFCAIGSAKTNVGHLDVAAGAASFIKTIMAMQHRLIPPSINFDIPNHHIDFINSPFYVNSRLTEWKNDKYPLRAGISAFGIGGTNAHVVLEEAPKVTAEETDDSGARLILLSTKTDSALQQAAKNLAEYLKNTPNMNLADVAYTLQVGRKAFPSRKMFVCSNVNEAVDILSNTDSDKIFTGVTKEENRPAWSQEFINSQVQALKQSQEKGTDSASLWEKIGRLWLQGVEIDWFSIYSKEKRHRVPLHTYPFERQRYWIEAESIKMGLNAAGKKDPFSKKPVIADWFYIPSWKRSGISSGQLDGISGSYCWLVFIDDCGVGAQLVKELEKKEQDVIIARQGSAFRQEKENEFTINPQKGFDSGYDDLFDQLNQAGMIPDKILHLWNITGIHQEELEIERAEKSQDLGFYSLLNIARAISKKNFNKKTEITVVTNNMQEVVGDDGLCPEKATVIGPIRVISMEYIDICCRSIDVVVPSPGTSEEKTLLNQLLEELTAESFEPFIAYRGKHRWIQGYELMPLEKPKKNTPLRQEGVYLVTGGLGGIGLALAQYLAKNVHAKLILTGRSHFPAREKWEQYSADSSEDDIISDKIRKVKALEKLGAEVLVCSADVSNREQMQEVMNQAVKRFGRINGVIHSAGLPDGELIQRATRETSERIFEAKIKGTLLLNSLLKDSKPDFFILCSSLGSILPGIGQVDYCAGNAFMDAFAHYNTLKKEGFTLAVNWERWKNVGMAVIAEQQHKELTGEELWGGITIEEGLEVFHRILGQTRPQFIVSSQDMETLIEEFKSFNISKMINAYEESKKPGILHPRTKLSTEYAAPRDKLEQILVDIWQEYFAVAPIGIFDDFFELGGDSLKGMWFVNQYNKLLEEIVFVNVVFDAPTIAELGDYFKRYFPKAVGKLTGIEISAEIECPGKTIDQETIDKIRQLLSISPPRPAIDKKKNQPAIFVLCTTRSGSTLLRVILAGHPRLFAPPELLLLIYNTVDEMKGTDQGLIRAIMQIKGCDLENARGIIEEFKRKQITTRQVYHLLQEWIGDRILVDKTPNYAENLDVLKRAEADFEEPLYIHLTRHPYGMIRSFDEAKMDLLMGRHALKDQLALSRLQLGELSWLICHQNILEFLKNIPGNRKHQVRFEDLVNQPRITVEGICQFLGLDFHPDMLDPYKDKNQRMTDGIHAEGVMVGDFKFHTHSGINASVAETWQKQYKEDFLSDITWNIAESFGYKRINEKKYSAINPAEKKYHYPLYSTQKRLYILQQRNLESKAYNITKIFLLEQEPDKNRLEETLKKLIRRHESLRTSFEIIDGDPAQKVHDNVEFEIDYFSMEQDTWDMGYEGEFKDSALKVENMIQDFIYPFDLSQPPLLRVGLIHTPLSPFQDQHRYFLMLDVHHIISDGISHDILLKDFMALYAGEELPKLSLHYKDFCQWRNRIAQSTDLKKQEEYWLKQFQRDIPTLAIPTDFVRPAVQSFDGNVFEFSIARKEAEGLKNLAKEENVTLFMVLLAIYNILLSKLSSQEDIIVGTGTAGRIHADLEKIIGIFVNTLALRNFPAADKTFKEFLKEVKQRTLQAFANQDYLFEDLVEKVVTGRDMNRNPLFDTVFMLHNLDGAPGDTSTLKKSSLKIKPYEFKRKTSQFDMTFICMELPEELRVSIVYCTKLFKKETIKAFADNFKDIVTRVIENKEGKLEEISLSLEYGNIKSAMIRKDMGDFAF